jgi:hypothetical protein
MRVLRIIAVFAVPVTIYIAWCEIRIAREKDEFNAFREVHNDTKIIGRTEQDIVRMYGSPFNIDRSYGGEIESITYLDPGYWYYCHISMKSGVAVRVSFEGLAIPPGPKYSE